MATGARQTRRALAVHATHDVHRVGYAGIELQRRVAGNVAILATRALEDFLNSIERLQGFPVFGEELCRIDEQADQQD